MMISFPVLHSFSPRMCVPVAFIATINVNVMLHTVVTTAAAADSGVDGSRWKEKDT